MTTSTERVKYINPEGACQAQGLYAHTARIPGVPLHFIAGQLAVGDDGGVVGKNDFEAQFRQIFNNMGDVLRGLGLDFNDIVRFNTFLVHSQHIESFMKLRSEVFPTLFEGELFPPNTLLVVDRLVKEDFLLEVEAIAYGRNG
ncbi:RidA family protein [Paenalcaligenes niemegkensis]|uniref:RidA family protein n=1 Tax=Paenalcaligenes niemegkensis TaxID=2895469 RepID=UPI001EE8B887|nr:RidA family protein [Paenalcaligenes niemegkensis]MCQ9617546.1 RidA family protein [Paenalcaligenes niemegkensis]